MRIPGRLWIGRILVMVATVLLSTVGAGIAGKAPSASAAFWPAGFDFWVDSGMGPIKSRIFRAHDGNTRRVVYALDGMRARPDLNGWEIETDIAQVLTAWNINVVMPVGGESSFYSDWSTPSSFGPISGSVSHGSSGSSGSSGFPARATWETFLTTDLPNALRSRLHFQSVRNGVFGLSMGGSAALTLAAYHPSQFNYAGSMSGFLNISAPGMPEAIRIAMMDAGGYNVDCMWGPPWSAGWRRNDPFVFAPLLRKENIRLYIAAGTGTPGAHDVIHQPIDLWNTMNAIGLESIASVETRAFQVRLTALGATNVVYDYSPRGTHNWGYWTDAAVRMIPDMSRYIG